MCNMFTDYRLDFFYTFCLCLYSITEAAVRYHHIRYSIPVFEFQFQIAGEPRICIVHSTRTCDVCRCQAGYPADYLPGLPFGVFSNFDRLAL